jgi:nucleoside-diphosphate-sugar epimerase
MQTARRICFIQGVWCWNSVVIGHAGSAACFSMLKHAGDIKSNDMWTYLDVRDAARAFRLGGEVPLEGHHRLLLAARDSWARDDIRVLVRRHYPNPASHVEHLNPEASLYTTRRAEEVLGFVPQHSWRDVPELNDKSHI